MHNKPNSIYSKAMMTAMCVFFTLGGVGIYITAISDDSTRETATREHYEQAFKAAEAAASLAIAELQKPGNLQIDADGRVVEWVECGAASSWAGVTGAGGEERPDTRLLKGHIQGIPYSVDVRSMWLARKSDVPHAHRPTERWLAALPPTARDSIIDFHDYYHVTAVADATDQALGHSFLPRVEVIVEVRGRSLMETYGIHAALFTETPGNVAIRGQDFIVSGEDRHFTDLLAGDDDGGRSWWEMGDLEALTGRPGKYAVSTNATRVYSSSGILQDAPIADDHALMDFLPQADDAYTRSEHPIDLRDFAGDIVGAERKPVAVVYCDQNGDPLTNDDVPLTGVLPLLFLAGESGRASGDGSSFTVAGTGNVNHTLSDARRLYEKITVLISPDVPFRSRPRWEGVENTIIRELNIIGEHHGVIDPETEMGVDHYQTVYLVDPLLPSPYETDDAGNVRMYPVADADGREIRDTGGAIVYRPKLLAASCMPTFTLDKPLDGAGTLIVNGNLVVDSLFAYAGTLVVLGDLTISPRRWRPGRPWTEVESDNPPRLIVMGNVMVKGETTIASPARLYWSQAMVAAAARQHRAGSLGVRRLSWRHGVGDAQTVVDNSHPPAVPHEM